MFQRLPERSRGQRKKLAQAARYWAAGLLHIPHPDDPDDAAARFDEAAAKPQNPWLAPHQGAPKGDSKVYLWPCNLPTWRLWHQLQTQWRVGMAWRTGLDYCAVIAYMGKKAFVQRKKFAGMFSEIQAMERACLAVWGEKHD